MKVLDLIDLFANEMCNEIFHSSASQELQDHLIEAVKQVKQTVIDTYEAETNRR